MLSEVFCCSCNLKDNIKDLFKEALDLNDVIIIVNPLKDKNIFMLQLFSLSHSLLYKYYHIDWIALIHNI